MEKIQNVVIIDGQGGSLGKALVESMKSRFKSIHVLAIGTNSLAASAMLRSGADAIATGENPVVVASRNADVIIGPLGIITADALHGEITPLMALSVAQSKAHKILLPISKCNVSVVGRKNLTLSELFDLSMEEISQYLVEK